MHVIYKDAHQDMPCGRYFEPENIRSGVSALVAVKDLRVHARCPETMTAERIQRKMLEKVFVHEWPFLRDGSSIGRGAVKHLKVLLDQRTK